MSCHVIIHVATGTATDQLIISQSPYRLWASLQASRTDFLWQLKTCYSAILKFKNDSKLRRRSGPAPVPLRPRSGPVPDPARFLKTLFRDLNNDFVLASTPGGELLGGTW